MKHKVLSQMTVKNTVICYINIQAIETWEF